MSQNCIMTNTSLLCKGQLFLAHQRCRLSGGHEIRCHRPEWVLHFRDGKKTIHIALETATTKNVDKLPELPSTTIRRSKHLARREGIWLMPIKRNPRDHNADTNMVYPDLYPALLVVALWTLEHSYYRTKWWKNTNRCHPTIYKGLHRC